jgi:hypothetical protein
MAMPRRDVRERRLRDNYAKLPAGQKENMGYGTVTKAGVAAAPKPMPKPKPVDPRASAGAHDSATIQGRLSDETTIPEADIKRGGVKSLKDLLKKKRGR